MKDGKSRQGSAQIKGTLRTRKQEAGKSVIASNGDRGRDAINDPTAAIATNRMARNHSLVLARVNIFRKIIVSHMSSLIHSPRWGEEGADPFNFNQRRPAVGGRSQE